MQPTLTSSPKPSIAEERTNCVNCGQPIENNFCSECGQTGEVRPVSWKNLWEEFSDHWLGMNNRFARTFVDLFTKPEQVFYSYLKGNRVQYLGPLSYYLIMTAVVLLVLSIMQVDTENIVRDEVIFGAKQGGDSVSQQGIDPVAMEFINNVAHYLSVVQRYISILTIPFFVLGVKTLFKKRFNNSIEITVFLLYISSQTFLLTLFQGIGLLIFQDPFTGIVTFLNYVYAGWFFGRMFTDNFSWRNGFKGIVAFVLGTFYLMLIVGVMSIIVLALILKIESMA